MPPPDYGFLVPGPQHLAVLRRWRDAPHVRRWWPDFDDEVADVASGRTHEGFTTRIVLADGTPFAWIQDYDLDRFPMAHGPALPAGSRGMDTMIGEESFLGKGHAPRYIRVRADALLAAGAPALVVDPEAANPRALRAWRAAGFAGEREVPGEGGRPVVLLTRHSPGENNPMNRDTR